MRKIICLMLTAAFAVSTVVAADFYLGVAAYKRGDFEEARREWEPLAVEGDPEAQYRLARLYYHGKIERNDAEAFRWYTAAAGAGHALAQNNLGLMYEGGRGVAADAAEALRWYREAAEQGLTTAQFNLGRVYETGPGGAPDGEQALRWYRLAAEQGHLKSQIRLAEMHDLGDGVPRDAKLAAKWHREAAKQGHGPSQSALGQMYDEGRGVERNAKKAAKWHGRASAQGIYPRTPALPTTSIVRSRPPEPDETDEPEEQASPAPRIVAERPATTTPAVKPPTVVDPTPAKAIDDPSPAVGRPKIAAPQPEETPPTPPPSPATKITPHGLAESGDVDAQYRLAQMYNIGQGLPRNLTEAGRWYREAAEQGHEMAGYRLAFLFLKGHVNSTRDYVEAHKWFSISAQRGIGDAGEWRDKIAKKMTREELDLSAKLVQEWRPRQ